MIYPPGYIVPGFRFVNNVAVSGSYVAVTDGYQNVLPWRMRSGAIDSFEIRGGTTAGGLYFGAINVNTGTIWSNQVTPAGTNFSLAATSASTTLNAPSSILFSISNSSIGGMTSTGTYLGSGTVSPAARLHVRGDGSNPILLLQDSTGTNNLVSVSNSGQVTIISRLTTATGASNNIFTMGNNVSIMVCEGVSTSILGFTLSRVVMYNSAANNGIALSSTITTSSGYGIVSYNMNNFTATSGTQGVAMVGGTFAPTSGTAVFNAFAVNLTVNQTGGANGITRAMLLTTSVTAADFRFIDCETGATNYFSVRQTGISTAAPSANGAGRILLGKIKAGAFLDIDPTRCFEISSDGSIVNLAIAIS